MTARGTANRVQYNKLRSSDWQALLRLAHDAAAFADRTAERRAFVSGRFCRLVGSVGTNLFELNPACLSGMPPRSTAECHGHLAGSEAVVNRYLDGLWASDPVPMEFHKSGRVVVQDADMVGRHAWEASDAYQQVRRPAGIDHQIYALLDCGPRRFALAIHRVPGERPFSAREMELAAAFATLGRHSWGLAGAVLPGQSPAAPAGPVDAGGHALPPRLAGVLRHLLRGDGAKQIAFATGLSRHTVYEYTKQLYRRYDVNGRGELLALFVRPVELRPPA